MQGLPRWTNDAFDPKLKKPKGIGLFGDSRRDGADRIGYLGLKEVRGSSQLRAGAGCWLSDGQHFKSNWKHV